jgi:hypothetical protein
MPRQPSTSGTNSPRGGSLSSAVSSLVRAQYGLTSQSESGASTTDLDKHVADLLLQEAKEREARAKASSNTTSWSFSDDEDGSKQYQNKTNKRFLKNILKGVEDHNAPLRRKESGETLEEIRQRERKAREIRLGVKDAERNKSKDASTSSSSLAPGRSAPGFAARMLANGLSGALNTREDRTREDKQIENAIEDARRRADRDKDRDNTASSLSEGSSKRDYTDAKGKQRERRGESDYEEKKEDRHRRRHRSRSRDLEETDHRSSSHRSRRETSGNQSDLDKRERNHRVRYVEHGLHSSFSFGADVKRFIF